MSETTFGRHADATDATNEDEVQFVPTEDLDVDTSGDDEVEDVEAEKSTDKPKAAKAEAKPKRGTLPEGYVTGVGLARAITERELYTTRDGAVAELKPQMVYSYAKNAPKDHPFPWVDVEDSTGTTRQAVDLEEGIAWWNEKNRRAAERRANAQEKAEKAAAKAAEKAEGAEADEDEGSAEEAE